MKRAARAAPPIIGAAVIWAAKPDEEALEAPPALEAPAAPALEALLEREAIADEAEEAMEEAAEEAEADTDDADPDAPDPAAPTAVKRVVEPTVEVVMALLPDVTVVRMAEVV
jgi:hypothetical protein